MALTWQFGALPPRVELIHTAEGAAEPVAVGSLAALFALDRKLLSADHEMARRFGAGSAGGAGGAGGKKTRVTRKEHGASMMLRIL